MRFDPTNDQKKALEAVIGWWQNPVHSYFTLGGYAGTGKTSLLSVFRQILKKLNPKTKVAFCAYTGKASQVLESSLRLHGARADTDSVSTIHSLIYAPVVNSKGSVTGWKPKQQIKADVIVVDEASMIDRQIWEDLLSFDLPILAVGDHGQLPPIKPGFNLMTRLDAKLEAIHRQAVDNPIIKLSIMARETGLIPVNNYGQGVKKLSRYDSASGSEVEELMQSSGKSLLILAGYNQTRIKLNQQMRTYFGFETPEPGSGDRVICLKNNWEKGIYNGMTGVIQSLKSEVIGPKSIEVYKTEIKMDDGTVFEGNMLRNQFNAPSTLADQINKKDDVDLFDFGYALTVHKAQGSQSPKVLLFEERNKYMTDEDWRRWLYTGITRAEDNLTIVG